MQKVRLGSVEGLIAAGLLMLIGVGLLINRLHQPRISETAVVPAVLEAPDDTAIGKRGSVYVPAYAGIRFGEGGSTLKLAVTLSIRNTSDSQSLVLEQVDYYDSQGVLVKNELPSPAALKPRNAVEFFVPERDMRGGLGAHFVVQWAGGSAISEPVVEAIMLGGIGNNSYSFVSVGRALDKN